MLKESGFLLKSDTGIYICCWFYMQDKIKKIFISTMQSLNKHLNGTQVVILTQIFFSDINRWLAIIIYILPTLSYFSRRFIYVKSCFCKVVISYTISKNYYKYCDVCDVISFFGYCLCISEKN